MKEYRTTKVVKTLEDIDWPALTLYEIVNNIDIDESIISLISLKFFHYATHIISHIIYINHKFIHQSKTTNLRKLVYDGNWIYENGNTSFTHGKMSSNSKVRKTLKEVCKNNRR